ncbi:MAG TPA: hypothetical protein VIH87_05480 [Methylocella sp.]
MQVQTSSQAFGPVSGNGPQVGTTSVTFPSPVSQATAILTGFIVEFSGGNDHHLGQLDVQVAVPPGGVNGANVTVNVTFGLRDWSGDWDDQYDGRIFFSVVAE